VDPAFVATFFALLLLFGAVGVVAAWLVPTVRESVAPAATTIAATVAGGAMAGSLYFSESAGYVPCTLCWWQRAAMYPLAVALAAGAVFGVERIRRPAIVVATIGLAIAAYHVQLQWFPDQGSFCDASNPCSGRWVEAFGWMTIPQMAGIAFALIIGVLALPRPTTLEAS
jgi:disulfide bond formation protein DsbB